MRTKLFTVLAVVASLSAACGSDDGAAVRETGNTGSSGSASGSHSASGSGSATASGTAEECKVENGADGAATDEIHAELADFTIKLDKTTVAAGKIKFEAKNVGKEPHEIAIVRADDPATLPVAKDGSADDAKLGDALIGEIEPFAAGQSCEGVFELAAGTYAVICNVVENHDGEEPHAHYAEKMYTTLTVS